MAGVTSILTTIRVLVNPHTTDATRCAIISSLADDALRRDVPGFVVDELGRPTFTATGAPAVSMHDFDADLGAFQQRLALAEACVQQGIGEPIALTSAATLLSKSKKERERSSPLAAGTAPHASVSVTSPTSDDAGFLRPPQSIVRLPTLADIALAARSDAYLQGELLQLISDVALPGTSLTDARAIASRVHRILVRRDRRAMQVMCRAHELLCAAACVEASVAVHAHADTRTCDEMLAAAVGERAPPRGAESRISHAELSNYAEAVHASMHRTVPSHTHVGGCTHSPTSSCDATGTSPSVDDVLYLSITIPNPLLHTERSMDGVSHADACARVGLLLEPATAPLLAFPLHTRLPQPHQPVVERAAAVSSSCPATGPHRERALYSLTHGRACINARARVGEYVQLDHQPARELEGVTTSVENTVEASPRNSHGDWCARRRMPGLRITGVTHGHAFSGMVQVHDIIVGVHAASQSSSAHAALIDPELRFVDCVWGAAPANSLQSPVSSSMPVAHLIVGDRAPTAATVGQAWSAADLVQALAGVKSSHVVLFVARPRVLIGVEAALRGCSYTDVVARPWTCGDSTATPPASTPLVPPPAIRTASTQPMSHIQALAEGDCFTRFVPRAKAVHALTHGLTSVCAGTHVVINDSLNAMGCEEGTFEDAHSFHRGGYVGYSPAGALRVEAALRAVLPRRHTLDEAKRLAVDESKRSPDEGKRDAGRGDVDKKRSHSDDLGPRGGVESSDVRPGVHSHGSDADAVHDSAGRGARVKRPSNRMIAAVETADMDVNDSGEAMEVDGELRGGSKAGAVTSMSSDAADGAANIHAASAPAPASAHPATMPLSTPPSATGTTTSPGVAHAGIKRPFSLVSDTAGAGGNAAGSDAEALATLKRSWSKSAAAAPAYLHAQAYVHLVVHPLTLAAADGRAALSSSAAGVGIIVHPSACVQRLGLLLSTSTHIRCGAHSFLISAAAPVAACSHARAMCDAMLAARLSTAGAAVAQCVSAHALTHGRAHVPAANVTLPATSSMTHMLAHVTALAEPLTRRYCIPTAAFASTVCEASHALVRALTHPPSHSHALRCVDVCVPDVTYTVMQALGVGAAAAASTVPIPCTRVAESDRTFTHVQDVHPHTQARGAGAAQTASTAHTWLSFFTLQHASAAFSRTPALRAYVHSTSPFVYTSCVGGGTSCLQAAADVLAAAVSSPPRPLADAHACDVPYTQLHHALAAARKEEGGASASPALAAVAMVVLTEASRRRLGALVVEFCSRGYMQLAGVCASWIPPHTAVYEAPGQISGVPIASADAMAASAPLTDADALKVMSTCACVPVTTWPFPHPVTLDARTLCLCVAAPVSPSAAHACDITLCQLYVVTGVLYTVLGQRLTHPAAVAAYIVAHLAVLSTGIAVHAPMNRARNS